MLYHGLPTPEGSQGSSDFVDSPLEDGSTTSRMNERPHEAGKWIPDAELAIPLTASLDHNLPVKKPSNKPSGNKKPKSSDNKSSSTFRFVVVDHPNQLRDRQEMRENRMHVMHDYLNKERRRPESRDTRVIGSLRLSRKQKDLGVPTPTKATVDVALPVNNFRVDVSLLTPSDSLGSDCSSDREVVEKSSKRPAPASRSKSGISSEPAALIRRVYNPPSDDQRLVSGIGGRWDYSAYMRATPNEIPVDPGARLEPFGTCKLCAYPHINCS